ncbi:Gfo/Idh/MocA family protein [Arcicella lustrica]|uniref:Gfo/Idh/MocA family oxidoreductase n=1 Tax=Arcicella lustrica TaxID=2984196 RepID=A0ABU5SI64_9BACT|nr:Gfo/Idh/MocA family oxidoreductase [Arcicella sp. DC25W]MEA5426980.1 Gfo/Idh/MocA family oxidoreductase [Arcicella sp. DC25W]
MENNSRRDFLKKSSLAVAGFYIVPRHVLGGKGFIAPSDKLNIAAIGCGGKGWSDILGAYDSGRNNIAALCDIDDRQMKQSVEKFPSANKYKDFRIMLEKEKDNIDAVTVSTPDHTHYVSAMAAMSLGKHVYVQKPLAHNIYEVRKMTEAAVQQKVVTQMGNQGSSGDGVRRMIEWYKAGLIGEVSKVHVWTNRPVWPQGIAKPTGKVEVPKEVDWDLWLGPAEWEDYQPAYHPFNWRGWVNYGTGSLGDMACHMMDPPYRVLGLGYPSEVECSIANTAWTGPFKEGYFPESYPAASMIHLKFPRKGKSDVKMTWYDGGLMPERPEEIPADVKLGDWSGGVLLLGTKGVMMCGVYGSNPTLWGSESLKAKGEKLPITIERVVGSDGAGHYQQWLQACRDGYGKHKPLSSSFDYSGPMSEAVLMGNLAIRSYFFRSPKKDKQWLQEYDYNGRKKLLWDGKEMKITNFDEANQFVKREYRQGWNL